MTPTLFTSCNALPPEGAARLRPGKAGSVARTCMTGATALVAASPARLEFVGLITLSREDFL